MLKTIAGTLAMAAIFATGCRKPEPAVEAPAQTQQQPYVVTLESGSSMKASGAPLDVTVLSDGKPVTDVDVSVELRMPPSASMGEMRTGADLKGSGDGHYRGQVDLGMAGKWTAIVRVKRGGQLLSTHNEPIDSIE